MKAATDLSNGGGFDVAICRKADDLTPARERLGACDRLVVESYVPIRRSPCFHYAVMADGSSRYLGFADQEIDANGRYRGNWIELGSTLPAEVIDIGMAVVNRSAVLGCRGLLGIDIVETEDARWFVVDLNFRVNGSTTAVLLAPAIQRELGQCYLHLRSFACEAGFAQLVSVARSALRTGKLIPLSAFHAEVAGYSGQPSRLTALVVGQSRAETQRIETELAAAGLV